MPDFAHIRRELQRNGVNKKLLWTEYLEDCRLSGEMPLMYSQFCYYIQQDEQKRRATMHIDRKPGEQVEVDWAGDPAYITDPDTGKATKAYIFVGELSYNTPDGSICFVPFHSVAPFFLRTKKTAIPPKGNCGNLVSLEPA